jgi:hypothetical protein
MVSLESRKCQLAFGTPTAIQQSAVVAETAKPKVKD